MPKLLSLLCVFLLACGGPAGQRVVEWPESDRLFLADARNGTVRVFDTRNGPVPYGQLMARERRSVRDMRLDADAAELWVLGDDALYRYDGRMLTLLERRDLPAAVDAWETLELADAAVFLVSATQRLRLSGPRTDDRAISPTAVAGCARSLCRVRAAD